MGGFNNALTVFICSLSHLYFFRLFQIFANLAKICRGGFVGLTLHQLGGVMQRLAEEFHTLLVAGSNPASATNKGGI